MRNIATLLRNNLARPSQRVFREARTLAEQGYNVTIFCYKYKGEDLPDNEEINGFKINRVEIERKKDLLPFPTVRGFHKAMKKRDFSNFDVFHAHDLETLPTAFAISKGKPVIYDSHEYYLGMIEKKYNPLIRWMIKKEEERLIRKCYHVFTVSEGIKELFIRNYGLPESRITVLYNVPYSKELSVEDSEKIKNKYNLPFESLVYVGWLLPNRGVEETLKALKIVKEKLPEIRFLIVGDGNILERLKIMVKDLEIEDNVIFTGFVPYKEFGKYIGACSIATLLYQGKKSSDHPIAMPNKLFIYLNCGVPVLGYRNSEVGRFIEENKVGKVCDETDPLNIANTVLEMLKNTNKLEKMKRQALELSKKYNWERESEKLVKVYESLKC